MKERLSPHHADKTDIRSLEHQRNRLSQGTSMIDEHYASIKSKFSLTKNKTETQDYSKETIDALEEIYRNRALEVFIRCLNGEISTFLIIQKPKTLLETYALCMEVQNLNFRNTFPHPHIRNDINDIKYNAAWRR